MRGLQSLFKDRKEQYGEEERHDVKSPDFKSYLSFVVLPSGGSKTAALVQTNIEAVIIAKAGLGTAFHSCEIVESRSRRGKMGEIEKSRDSVSEMALAAFSSEGADNLDL